MSNTRDVRRPIADHGVIGNMRTLALVATDGAIDFMCWPNFDSPSLFASLLDDEQGGTFELHPEIDHARVVQAYVPESNVLSTRWLSADASVEIIDLMTVSDDGYPRLIRRVSVSRGSAQITLRCAPRFDYARVTPTLTIGAADALFSGAGSPSVRLRGDVAFVAVDGGANATFVLSAGDVEDFILEDEGAYALSALQVTAAIDDTNRFWKVWSESSKYRGRWRAAVARSALVLKLLSSSRHGSVVAAGTFGLPEAPGAERNWDYRAAWIRDASFTVYGLIRLGHVDEATAFTRWASDRAAACPDGRLQIMYAPDGGPVPEEKSLDYLAGYGGAKPVRIGNGAASQLQLDIYGALLDSIYLSNKYGESISHDDWDGICRVMDYLCNNWQLPDAGIWEARNEPEEHLHSRLMCWVAVDRALRLAQKRSLTAPFVKWEEVRNAISNDIWTNFWNADAGYFARAKGSAALDGAMLMMPLVRFVSATDPRWLATLDAIGERLNDDGLVSRYDSEDGLQGKEGSFGACAFWYVECLARAGRVEEARTNFERLLTYGNHLSLYAEEFSVTAEPCGNFPQALTHLALISAAYYLDRAIDRPNDQEWRA